nr:hypothetical protein [Tanacetum cinerariifolium]
GISITHRFFPRVSGRFGLAYGRITAEDGDNANRDDSNARYRYTRNMNFRNDIAEASADYSKVSFAIPFGAGVRYRINRNLDASFEIGLRKTFTGYLDDVNGSYANLSGKSAESQYFGGYNGGTVPGELSGVVEYNFLDYHDRRDQNRIHLSPYLFIGLAPYYAHTTTESQNPALQSAFNRKGGQFSVAIPAGAGIKVALSPRWNLGAEIGARKTFSDQLDHLGDQDPLL